jgi:hypothetical protein
MATKGVIIYRGDTGNPNNHYAKGQIDSVTDASALDTLATALEAHTNCNVSKKSFLSNTLGVDAPPAAGANVDVKAIVYFRHPTTLKVHSVTIPSPVTADIEETADGTRVKAASVSTIVGLINTATGITYSPLYGVVVQKR